MDINEPFQTEVVNLTGQNDHTFTLKVQSIYCNAAGLMWVKLRGDSHNAPYRVTQGQVLFGAFEKVIKNGTDSALQAENALVGQRSADFEPREPLRDYPKPE